MVPIMTTTVFRPGDGLLQSVKAEFKLDHMWKSLLVAQHHHDVYDDADDVDDVDNDDDDVDEFKRREPEEKPLSLGQIQPVLLSPDFQM